MGKLIGYARVSIGEQNLQLQLDALKTAGCSNDDIYMDKASGARGSRPGLDACVAALEPGDTLIVWRLDRLGRSMPHLVGLVEELPGKGIDFRSLQDGAIDTTTASGDLMFNIFSSLAQFARRLIQERTQAGLAAAQARGRKGGRRPISPDDPRVVTAKRLYQARGLTIDQISRPWGFPGQRSTDIWRCQTPPMIMIVQDNGLFKVWQNLTGQESSDRRRCLDGCRDTSMEGG
jgi:DNA invertase Pin-like site-specific DNA recombinase